MNILIENCKTHQFLKTLGTWTSNLAEAKFFQNSTEALKFCNEHEIPKAQILLKFSDARYDVKLPVSEECRDKPDC